MRRLDLSLGVLADNLALDEALLLAADQSPAETLRFWRFPIPVVVLGRGSKIRDEVDVDFCQHHSIPILRRCSGGASILADPDCLMYSVVLNLDARPLLRNVDQAHAYVIGQLAAAVQLQRPEIRFQGTCDLTLDEKKFSGNSLRVARSHLLYHGTILQQVDPKLVGRCLRTAPRQPDYRQARSHEQFITPIAINASELCNDLAARYQVTVAMDDWPEAEMRTLSDTKYSTEEWTWRH